MDAAPPPAGPEPEGAEAESTDPAGSSGRRAKAVVRRAADAVIRHRTDIVGVAALALTVWYPHRHASGVRQVTCVLALWAALGLLLALGRWAHDHPVGRWWWAGYGLGAAALSVVVVQDLARHQAIAVWSVLTTAAFVPLLLVVVAGHLSGIAAALATVAAASVLALGLFGGGEASAGLGAALLGDLDGAAEVDPTVEPVEPAPAAVVVDPPPTTTDSAPPADPVTAEPRFTG